MEIAHCDRANKKTGPIGPAENGEGGIRTLDRVAPIQHFQCCAFDHSATSPGARLARQNVAGRFHMN